MQPITPEQVELFYPLNVGIDLNNVIVHLSPRLAGLVDRDVLGLKFQDAFRVVRPKLRPSDAGRELLRHSKRLFLLTDNQEKLGFRGQLFAGAMDQSDILILALTPWLTWFKENNPAYVPDHETYPIQDSQRDLEMYLNAQRATMEDLRDMAQNLRAANQQIAQTMKVRTKFLSYVSHELRTPLTGIISALPLFQSQTLDVEGMELLDVMKSSSRALLEVINQVIDFNEASEASDHIKLEPFSFKELMSEAMEITRLGARHKDLLLLSEIEEPLLSLIFDSDRNKIKKILLNLLSNAAKYTAAGRIKLRASMQQVQSGVYTVLIRIDDDGAGVEEEYVQYLFDHYWKKLRNIDPNTPSSGLGLSITRQLVDALGGKVGYRRSEIFSGSEFWVELPLAEAELESYQGFSLDIRDEYALQENSLSGDVLLVDDNNVNLLVGKLTLERTGLKVVTAGSGMEAIAKAHGQKFSVIFMDILMPEMNGLDCAQVIKSTDNLNNATPVVAWSAHCSQEDMLRYHTYGIDDWVVKPPKPAVIVDIVKKWQGVHAALT